MPTMSHISSLVWFRQHVLGATLWHCHTLRELCPGAGSRVALVICPDDLASAMALCSTLSCHAGDGRCEKAMGSPQDTSHYVSNPLAGDHPPYICHSKSQESLPLGTTGSQLGSTSWHLQGSGFQSKMKSQLFEGHRVVGQQHRNGEASNRLKLKIER